MRRDTGVSTLVHAGYIGLMEIQMDNQMENEMEGTATVYRVKKRTMCWFFPE